MCDRIDIQHGGWNRAATQFGEQEVNQDRQQRSMIEYDAAMKRLGGDQELFVEFVEIFLEDSPEHFAEFNAGLQTDDAQRVRHAAHALKGLASNFGAQDFCRSAQTIEASAASGELDDCREKQNELAAMLNRLSGELANHLKN